jgi:hypothetical protein
MLPPDHPCVVQLLDDMKDKFARRWTNNATFNRSLDFGIGWEKCFVRHQKARKWLLDVFGLPV